MRQTTQILSAAGAAPWVPVDYRGTQFGVAIGVSVSNGATLNYTVQHSFDDPYEQVPVTITRAGAVATALFKEPHGLVAGDSINVLGHREDNLLGVFDVATAPSDTTLTFAVQASGATSVRGSAVVFSVHNNDDLTNQTTTQDGNYAFPPAVMRLRLNSYTDGQAKASYRFLSR